MCPPPITESSYVCATSTRSSARHCCILALRVWQCLQLYTLRKYASWLVTIVNVSPFRVEGFTSLSRDSIRNPLSIHGSMTIITSQSSGPIQRWKTKHHNSLRPRRFVYCRKSKHSLRKYPVMSVSRPAWRCSNFILAAHLQVRTALLCIYTGGLENESEYY